MQIYLNNLKQVYRMVLSGIQLQRIDWIYPEKSPWTAKSFKLWQPMDL